MPLAYGGLSARPLVGLIVAAAVAANPFISFVQDLPAAQPRQALTWTWSYNPNLIGQDLLPFRQQDWPLPSRGPEPDQRRSWTWSYNLDLIGQDLLPAGKQSFELAPRDYQRLFQTWTQSFNPALNALPPPPPPNQYDWPLPRGAEPDWRRSWTWSYNLNLIGQDRLPVGKQVYDLAPRDYQRLFQTWTQSESLALFIIPPTKPFNQYDWPLPQIARQPAFSWTSSYDLSLIGQDKLPFNQYYWPNPFAHTVPTLLQTWYFSRAHLLPPPQFPPGENVYDRPQLRVNTPADLYFIGARFPIIPPPPVPVFGASYRLLSSHYLFTGYYTPNTIVTEGLEIPFGWIPTLAVDPLNTQAVTAFYNAGPRSVTYDDLNTYDTMYRPNYGDVPVSPPATFWQQIPGTGLYQLTGLGAGKPPVGGG